MHLVSRLVTQGFDDAALRLVGDVSTVVQQRIREGRDGADGLSGRELEEKLLQLFEHPLKQITRRSPSSQIYWPTVLAFTQKALSRSIISPTILSIRMRALAEMNRHVDVLSAFALFETHGFEPTGGDFDEAILAHLHNLELAEAQSLLAVKGEKGFTTTVRTCMALLEGMAPYGGNRVMEQKMLVEAEEDALRVGEAPRQNVRVLNKILSVRSGRLDLQGAVEILEYFDFSAWPEDLLSQLASLGPSPLGTPSSPSQSSSSHSAPSSTTPSPHDLFPRPAPDVATLVTLVGLTLRARRVDLAVALLATAHRLSSEFNQFVAASIVRTLLAMHDLSSAERFVFDLPSGTSTFAGLQYPALNPEEAVYEVFFDGLLRYRGVQGAVEAFTLLREQQRSKRVTAGMTRALVQHLALEVEAPSSLSADVLLQVQKLTGGKVRADARHVETLLRAAWQVERTRRKKGELSVEEEFPILDGAVLSSSADNLSLTKPPPSPHPSSPPLVPDSDSSSSPAYLPPEAELLAASPSSPSTRNPSSLSRIRHSLADRHILPTRTTTRHILRNDHLLRYIPAKWSFLQSQVLDLGIRPTPHHIAVLLRAYLLLGDAKGAHLALQYAIDELQMPPSVEMYSTLIAGHARLGEHTAAMAAYAEMKQRRVEPDRTLFAALAMSCARRRDTAGVERVLEDVRRHAREKTPHPQLVALAQAQALQTRAGVPATLLTQYDPLLDPVFVAILYRTLVAVGRLEDAQQRIGDSLSKGLVPDAVLLKALRQSERWLTRKRNNASGKTPVPSTSSSITSSSPSSSLSVDPARMLVTEVGTGFAKVGTREQRLSLSEIDYLLNLVRTNISAVVKATRGMKHVLSWREMKRMQNLWAEAEKDGKKGRTAAREEEAEKEDVREEGEMEEEMEEELRKIEESYRI